MQHDEGMVIHTPVSDINRGASQGRSNEEDLDQAALLDLWSMSCDDVWLAGGAYPIAQSRSEAMCGTRRSAGQHVADRRGRQRANGNF
jgi:hypothetical protein